MIICMIYKMGTLQNKKMFITIMGPWSQHHKICVLCQCEKYLPMNQRPEAGRQAMIAPF
jgi:hypothetical protein